MRFSCVKGVLIDEMIVGHETNHAIAPLKRRSAHLKKRT
jgi:hypothetical protein